MCVHPYLSEPLFCGSWHLTVHAAGCRVSSGPSLDHLVISQSKCNSRTNYLSRVKIRESEKSLVVKKPVDRINWQTL